MVQLFHEFRQVLTRSKNHAIRFASYVRAPLPSREMELTLVSQLMSRTLSHVQASTRTCMSMYTVHMYVQTDRQTHACTCIVVNYIFGRPPICLCIPRSLSPFDDSSAAAVNLDTGNRKKMCYKIRPRAGN